MGTWDTGPFDNDSAADFAYDIQESSTPQERHDVLLMTMRRGTEYVAGHRLDNMYSWGDEVEHAIAAAAFTADEHTGIKQFTNCSYARGVDDDMELKPFAEIQMSGELLGAARLFTAAMLRRMKRDDIDDEWVEPVRQIREALNKEV